MKLAHISEDKTREQTIKAHSEGTAKLASGFASEFGGERFAFSAGMLHDIGKYADEFQNRLHGSQEKYEHSAAGAWLLYNSKNLSGYLLSYCVAGHHTGLPDGGNEIDSTCGATLCSKLNRYRKNRIDCSEGMAELDAAKYLAPIGFPFKFNDAYSAAFFTRMIFSSLTDADFLDTEMFMNNGITSRNAGESLETLAAKLEKHMEKYSHPQSEIDVMRNDVYRKCLQAAEEEPGIFRLCVPTGGGKTLSSIDFALRHALKNGKRRVIFCIPYISIIRQTAGIFKDIFGEENVLAHYSTVEYSETDESPSPLRLAAENWDKPIIVTTNVQFFESLYASGTSRCRKLHNIANSVVVFDEAQMIPNDYLLPCLRAVSELCNYYNVSSVWCTATQPAFETLINNRIKDIYPDYKKLFELLRRVTYRSVGYRSNQDMADTLNSRESCLCIVNAKKTAREYFALLTGEGKYHLSTFMCQAHIADKLEIIRDRLVKNLPCRVVSTSLVEAGIDIDFPQVFREYTGLDSIIQAGGRCNRENKRKADESFVTLFISENMQKRISPELNNAKNVTLEIEAKYQDISSPEAINEYFSVLYGNEMSRTGLDIKNILKKSGERSIEFAEIAKEFELIESPTEPVIIPYDAKAAEICSKLSSGETGRALLRSAGPYVVQLYEHQLRSLHDLGALELTGSGIAVLLDMRYYSDDTGILFPSNGQAIIV